MARSVVVRLLISCGVLLAALAPVLPATAAPGERCFTETNQCLAGRFLAYWEANGGLARNGYPLTPERREVLEDGKEYTVQYFERVRMEYHPENVAPYDVLLGQFGWLFFRESFRTQTFAYMQAIAPVTAKAGMAYFTETGHNVGSRFLMYWQANGGVTQFGYPLGEEFTEQLGLRGTAQARPTLVQYFERARFEYHPENAGTPYEMLLGQFGRDVDHWATSLADPIAPFYRANPQLRAQIGTPTLSLAIGDPETQVYTRPGALLAFEHGLMIATEGGRIQVLCGTMESGTAVVGSRAVFGEYDPWTPNQPVGGGAGPRPDTYEPPRGFGLVWRSYRDCLGYATSPDATPYTQALQIFARGWLISTPDGRAVYALFIEQHSPEDFVANPPEHGANRYQRYLLPK